MKSCSVAECNLPARCWGFCSKHFQRVRKFGDPHKRVRQAKGETGFICTVEGCNNPHKAKGFCALHYQRFKRFNNPLFTKINPHGVGTITRDGYRKITINGKRILEHRYVMELHLGRPLRSDEIVHHADGNRLNNIIENLQVMSQSHHIKDSPNCLNALAVGRTHRWSKQRGTKSR